MADTKNGFFKIANSQLTVELLRLQRIVFPTAGMGNWYYYFFFSFMRAKNNFGKRLTFMDTSKQYYVCMYAMAGMA